MRRDLKDEQAQQRVLRDERSCLTCCSRYKAGFLTPYEKDSSDHDGSSTAQAELEDSGLE